MEFLAPVRHPRVQALPPPANFRNAHISLVGDDEVYYSNGIQWTKQGAAGAAPADANASVGKVLKATTANATATILTTDGAAATASNQLIIPLNSALAFEGLIVARQKTGEGTACSAWSVNGVARREGSGAPVNFQNNINVISNSQTWSIAITGDATGALKITVTGAAGVNIGWNANLKTSLVTF